MKNLIFFLACTLGFIVCSCGTTNNSSNTLNDSTYQAGDIIDPDQSISLVDHLRRVPGVHISGDGPNASVKIRGISSINSSNEPLFILDGQQLTGGLRAATQLVPVNEIKFIRVLKNPEDTGIYGVRGANGVIEIALK